MSAYLINGNYANRRCRKKRYTTFSHTCYSTSTEIEKYQFDGVSSTTLYTTTSWESRMSTYQRVTTQRDYVTYPIEAEREKTFIQEKVYKVTANCDCHIPSPCCDTNIVEGGKESISTTTKKYSRYTDSTSWESTVKTSSTYEEIDELTSYKTFLDKNMSGVRKSVYTVTWVNPENKKELLSEKLEESYTYTSSGYQIDTVNYENSSSSYTEETIKSVITKLSSSISTSTYEHTISDKGISYENKKVGEEIINKETTYVSTYTIYSVNPYSTISNTKYDIASRIVTLSTISNWTGMSTISTLSKLNNSWVHHTTVTGASSNTYIGIISSSNLPYKVSASITKLDWTKEITSLETFTSDKDPNIILNPLREVNTTREAITYMEFVEPIYEAVPMEVNEPIVQIEEITVPHYFARYHNTTLTITKSESFAVTSTRLSLVVDTYSVSRTLTSYYRTSTELSSSFWTTSSEIKNTEYTTITKKKISNCCKPHYCKCKHNKN